MNIIFGPARGLLRRQRGQTPVSVAGVALGVAISGAIAALITVTAEARSEGAARWWGPG
jgi:hypothetical protein